jgi:hypothetical protein
MNRTHASFHEPQSPRNSRPWQNEQHIQWLLRPNYANPNSSTVIVRRPQT